MSEPERAHDHLKKQRNPDATEVTDDHRIQQGAAKLRLSTRCPFPRPVVAMDCFQQPSSWHRNWRWMLRARK